LPLESIAELHSPARRWFAFEFLSIRRDQRPPLAYEGHAMRINRLRALLDAGSPTLGTHLLSTWPTLVELVGQTGRYDYIEFTAEYAPFDLHDLDNLGRALELMDLGGMMKVEQSEWMHQSMRAIGAGFQSILFADVRSVEDAEYCVRCVRAETPKAGGLHGVGMRRDVGVIREAGSPAFVKALDEIVIAIMVEKRECVENLETILDVKGIDMVQFGPADYAMSIGMPGQFQHPDVQKAQRKTIEAALKHGLHPRVELFDAAQAAPYVEMGVKHFCLGWDVSILKGWWLDHGTRLRGAVEAAASTPALKSKDKTRKSPPKSGY
jgi:2-keto-3-deoxy-L-rhamnonate aldolase RhmA